MNIKVNFDNFNVKEVHKENKIKILMLKGEKGDSVSAEWGTITGTLSEQTDLQAALNLKANQTSIEALNEQIEGLDTNKSEKSEVYTKEEADDLLDEKVDNSTLEAIGIPDNFFTNNEIITGSGSNIELDNTALAMIKDIKIYGDTKQNSTPTPDNPVEVENVTGTQIITVRNEDNSQSQVYTLSLGDLKLYAIGDTRDYIYKNNGKWYRHIEIGSISIASPEWAAINVNSANPSNISSDGAFCFFWNNNHISALSGQLLSNYMIWQSQTITGNGGANAMINNTFVQRSGTNDRIYYRNTSLIGKTGYELTEMMENLELYYILANPIEIEITDLTLIQQLDDLWHIKTYDGTTNIEVVGSLTTLIWVEAYNNGWDSTISGISNELDDVFAKIKADNPINDRIQFIFPKFWANAYSGDANVIKYLDKVIMIDCYNANQWNNVRTMLNDNQITHIDYFILTHYHGDHYGNFTNLVDNNFIDNETKLYMPVETTKFSDYTHFSTDYKNYCNNHNLNYYIPSEYEELNIYNLKITFFNCDVTLMEQYYYDNTTQPHYNNMSTICLIEHKNIKALYTGDAENLAYQRMKENNFPAGKVDLFKIGHHGINYRTNLDFVRNIAPTYAVQSGGISDFAKNNYGITQEISLMRTMGTLVYPTFIQNDYLKFISDGSYINCDNGKPYSVAHQEENINLYVDINNSSTSEIQDGSQEHPFHELMQAIGSIDYNHVTTATIYLADGTYGVSHDGEAYKNLIKIFNSKKTRIYITGNSNDRTAVVINSCQIINSDVVLRHLTVNMPNTHGIDLINSNFLAEDILIDNLDTQNPSTEYNCVYARLNSTFAIQDSKLNNGNQAINSYGNCSCILENVTFGTFYSNYLFTCTTTNINTKNLLFDNASDKISFSQAYSEVRNPEIIFKGDEFSQATLIKNLTEYEWFEIEYASSDNVYSSTGKITSLSSSGSTQYVSAAIHFKSASNNVVYNKQARFLVANSTIQVIDQTQISYSGTGANTAINKTDSGDYIKITKVTAGWDNSRDLT